MARGRNRNIRSASPISGSSSAQREDVIDSATRIKNQKPKEAPDYDYTDQSPYVLSNGDSPGNMIISEVLDGTNYNSWKIAMTVALDAKNKLVFIDGTLPRPAESHPSFRVWSRCNSMVKSWILCSVSKQIYRSILKFKDSSEIWKDLMQRFHVTNLPRSYSITQQIWNIQQGSKTLSEYYTALKILWDDLEGADNVVTCHNCNCCQAMETKEEHARIIKFLAGLNETYATIRSNIIMKKTVPELSEIYNLLDQDYSQRSIGTSNASVFQVAAANQEEFSVNASLHANTVPIPKNKVICSHCGYTGHTVDKCYRIHGYPAGFKHKGKNQPKPDQSKPVVASVKMLTDSAGPSEYKQKEVVISELASGLTKEQLQDAVTYFSAQLHLSETEPVTVGTTPEAPCGFYQGVEDWTG